MKGPAIFAAALGVAALAGTAFVEHAIYGSTLSFSFDEADFETSDDLGPEPEIDPYAGWTRPEGPIRIALQAGHWKAAEAPDELERLRANGASAAGVSEWQVNLGIAEETKKLLEAEGFDVEILPTTIPPDYWADVFVSIHADGNKDTAVTGYKAASPRRDRTGRAAELARLLEQEYEKATGLPYEPNVTRNMRGYYAFNWRRYEHALHPMTTAAILETGFLTNPSDRRIIVHDKKKAARGVAAGILEYLKLHGPELD
jgi:hypothetical protein